MMDLGEVAGNYLKRGAEGFDRFTTRANNALASALGLPPPFPTAVPTTPQFDERAFQAWYANHAKNLNLNPNPDDPRHHYDYRAAYMAGAEPDPQTGHWDSRFKAPDHPNRFVNGIDTITGLPAGPTPTPAPTPATPTPGPGPAPGFTTNWDIYQAPRASFVGGSNMTLGQTGAEHWGQIGETADFLRRHNLPPISMRELAPIFIDMLKSDLGRQVAEIFGRGSAFPIFNIQGDPFANNIREVNLPYNAPLTGERLFWRERAL